MLSPSVGTYKVTLGSLAGKDFYSINGVINNPPITVMRGDNIRFEIDTPDEPFVIKTGLGGGYAFSYALSPGTNGISSGVIQWEVQENTPAELYYQSAADSGLWGLIQVVELQTDKQLRVVPLDNLVNMSVEDLVSVMNHNVSLALSRNQDLAGPGLVWNGTEFNLDIDTTVYEDEQGLFKSTRTIVLDDQAEIVGRPVGQLTISQALNDIVTQIRRLVGGARWNTPPTRSINELNIKTEELNARIGVISPQLVSLKRDYEELLANYTELLAIYAKHQHNAIDIVAGQFNPARLASGVWAEGKTIVVNANGELVWQ